MRFKLVHNMWDAAFAADNRCFRDTERDLWTFVKRDRWTACEELLLLSARVPDRDGWSVPVVRIACLSIQ